MCVVAPGWQQSPMKRRQRREEYLELEAAVFQSMKFSYQQQPALHRLDQPKTKETHGRKAIL